mmetsp:Transcript_11078/g.33132  ORF Transcript_11078/g.33132 Transcript_11078/m.33132 type:complete len:210 (-) Transcript_11078:108-737(-)
MLTVSWSTLRWNRFSSVSSPPPSPAAEPDGGATLIPNEAASSLTISRRSASARAASPPWALVWACSLALMASRTTSRPSTPCICVTISRASARMTSLSSSAFCCASSCASSFSEKIELLASAASISSLSTMGSRKRDCNAQASPPPARSVIGSPSDPRSVSAAAPSTMTHGMVMASRCDAPIRTGPLPSAELSTTIAAAPAFCARRAFW